jgi:hypothetical protein
MKQQKSLKVQLDTRLSPSVCLDCGKVLDMAAAVVESAAQRPRVHKPRPGDVTVCWRCGHVMAFDNELQLRNLTAQEIVQIAGDPAILAIQKGRAAYERTKALSGGVPPGHPGDSVAESLPAGMPSTNGLGKNTSGGGDR